MTTYAKLARIAALPWVPFTPDCYEAWGGAGADAHVARVDGTTWVRSECWESPGENYLVVEAYRDEDGEMLERFSFRIEDRII